MDGPSQALQLVRRFLDELDPDTVPVGRAAELLEVFAELERASTAGRILLAPRAVHADRWEKAGHRDAASWMADVCGVPYAEALGTLKTAEQLDELPAVTEAVRRGELSVRQTTEIVAAGSQDPRTEGELLQAAASTSFDELRHTCRQVRARAASERSRAAKEEQIRRRRYLRSWVDDDGAFRLDARLTMEDGAAVMGALEHRAKECFEAARAEGLRHSSGAYLADALVALCTAPGGAAAVSAGHPPASVHLRVDLAALRRGALDEGECCEIPGVGPVSLATARSLVGDSFLKLMVADGVDVHAVTHAGRTIPAHVRSALQARDPACVVPGCGGRHGLEIVHYQVPFAEGGPSELWNLARLCRFHHRRKTHAGYVLVGGPGAWEFLSPDEVWEDDDVGPPARGDPLAGLFDAV